MIFRQLFEQASPTNSYLMACGDTKRAVLIDPVLETVGRDQAVLAELGLELEYSLETHIHADHITAACRLRSLTGCKVAYPETDGLACADVLVNEVNPLQVGALTLQPLFTPGPTDAHHSYLLTSEEHTSELQSLMRISYA